MDFIQKKKEMEIVFNKTKEEVDLLKRQITEKENELLRLQGEYRLINEIINKKDGELKDN